MNDVMARKWHDLLSTWDVDTLLAGRKLGEVFTHYSEPSRFYHTLEHIQLVLETVENLATFARNPGAVKLAAWLHDVIYDSQASDNEERSAEFAMRLCDEFGIPEGGDVALLILKTKTHDAREDPDAKILLDADLSVLGASETDYRVYAEQIRQEYAWAPESAYRNGRRNVLMRFLARPKIFHLLGHLEGPARRNLAAEIGQLDLH